MKSLIGDALDWVGSTYSLNEKAADRLDVAPNGSLLPDC